MIVEVYNNVMDAGGVDLAVACSLGQQIDNEYIARICAQHPRRLTGFGQVNPRVPGAADEVRRCADLGLRGLKLHPTLHGYHVADHGLLDPIFRAAAGTGLVVLVNALDDPLQMLRIPEVDPALATAAHGRAEITRCIETMARAVRAGIDEPQPKPE